MVKVHKNSLLNNFRIYILTKLKNFVIVINAQLNLSHSRQICTPQYSRKYYFQRSLYS